MLKSNFNAVLKGAAVALLLPAGIGAVMLVSAEPAYAERGNSNGNGNGNGNGHGKADRDRAERGNSNQEANGGGNNGHGNNGRGAIASELKGLNAAHASPTALASAAPGSMPGKLNSYREAYEGEAIAELEAQEAGDLYDALLAMTEERFVELNPTLDYATTLIEAAASYEDANATLATANTSADTSLLTLTGGRTLSEGAMSELHALLGL